MNFGCPKKYADFYRSQSYSPRYQKWILNFASRDPVFHKKLLAEIEGGNRKRNTNSSEAAQAARGEQAAPLGDETG
jgi:hypothetical protein